MVKERFDYLDIARGIGIIMVVWAHVAKHWTGAMFYTFHMPLFFLISGMLFNPAKYSDFKTFIIRRSKRLLIPYAIYSVATWLVWVAFNAVTSKPLDDCWYPLLQTIVAQGSGQFFWHNSPLWFVPCLLAVEMMYFFIARWRDWLVLLASFAIAGISMVLEYVFHDDYLLLLPWNFDAAMMALPFYAVGNIVIHRISHQQINQWINAHQWLAAICILAVFIGLTLSLRWWGSPSMGHSYYGNWWVFYIRAFVGSMAVVVLSALIASRKVIKSFNDYLKWLGKVSLDVMCTHVPLKGVLIVFVAAIVHNTTNEVSQNVGLASLVFVVTLLADSILVYCINNFLKTKNQ